MPKPIRRVDLNRAVQNGAEAAMRRDRDRKRGEVLDRFRTIDTSKPANPTPIRVIPKPGAGPFKPNVKLDRSQVSDRRGNSKRSGR